MRLFAHSIGQGLVGYAMLYLYLASPTLLTRVPNPKIAVFNKEEKEVSQRGVFFVLVGWVCGWCWVCLVLVVFGFMVGWFVLLLFYLLLVF